MTSRFERAGKQIIGFAPPRRWARQELSVMAQRLRERAKILTADGGQPERLQRVARQLDQLTR